MVDFQSISYMAAATSVVVASIYYILMLRIANRNRRIQLVTQLSHDLINEEGMRRYFELLNMQWDNYDDFERKYGSDFNLDACSKRYSSWAIYDNLGYMLKKGMIDVEDLYSIAGIGAIWQWAKWEKIIEELRRRYNGQDWMTGFEYLAQETMKIKNLREQSYRVPETFGKYVPDK